MRIAIIGAGGVGGYLAAKLAAAGTDVSVVARGGHLDRIRLRGLTLRTPQGETRTPLTATDRAADIGPVDAVLVAVKGQDLDGLELRPLMRPDTVIWPFLNGVEATERLDAAYGAGRSLIGIARISATIAEPGVVAMHGAFAKFELGEPTGGISPRVAALRDLAAGAGIEVVTPPDPLRALWLKFMMLGPLSGATAAARCDAGTLRAEPRLTALYRALAEETCAVGRAQGVALDEGDVEGSMKALAQMPEGMRASMAHDLAAGKPLEVDWLAGAVVRLGEAHKLKTPANAAVWAVLKPWAKGGVRR
jgi:2-dehydropantoate 2-reductase